MRRSSQFSSSDAGYEDCISATTGTGKLENIVESKFIPSKITSMQAVIWESETDTEPFWMPL